MGLEPLQSVIPRELSKSVWGFLDDPISKAVFIEKLQHNIGNIEGLKYSSLYACSGKT